MVKWLLAAILLLLAGASAQAQLNGCPAGFCGPTAPGRTTPPQHATGTCAQSNAWFQRVVNLSDQESKAYNVLICGLVADGIINGSLASAASCGTVLDGLYIFATNNTTTSNLNLCGTKYPLNPVQGLPVLTPDVGYTPNNGCLTTNFVPLVAGGNMTINSAHWGVYILTNRTSATLTAVLGVSDTNGDTLQFFPLYTSTPAMDISVNTAIGGDSVINPVATTQGSWIASRTGASLTTLYRNGSSLLTTATASGSLLPYQTFYLLGRDFLNGCNVPDTVQVSAAWFGAGLNSTQAQQIQARINTYMQAFGINVY